MVPFKSSIHSQIAAAWDARVKASAWSRCVFTTHSGKHSGSLLDVNGSEPAPPPLLMLLLLLLLLLSLLLLPVFLSPTLLLLLVSLAFCKVGLPELRLSCEPRPLPAGASASLVLAGSRPPPWAVDTPAAAASRAEGASACAGGATGVQGTCTHTRCAARKFPSSRMSLSLGAAQHRREAREFPKKGAMLTSLQEEQLDPAALRILI